MTIERLKQLAEQARKEPIYPDDRFPPSLYYRFLKVLAQEMKPRLAVELGVCGGGGSLHMAMTGCKTIGVDYQWDHEDNVNHIIENYKNFEFMLSDSIAAAPKIMNKYGKIDLLFIDTDHTYQRTVDEFNAYKPFLADNAIVCFDDILRHHPDHC